MVFLVPTQLHQMMFLIRNEKKNSFSLKSLAKIHILYIYLICNISFLNVLPKNQYYFYSLFIISNFKTYAILVISRYLSYVLIFFLLHNTLVTQIILKANNNCLLLNSANAWGRLNFLLYNKKEVLLSNFERHNKQHCQAVSTITAKILLLNTLFRIKATTNYIYK